MMIGGICELKFANNVIKSGMGASGRKDGVIAARDDHTRFRVNDSNAGDGKRITHARAVLRAIGALEPRAMTDHGQALVACGN
jgi:hypothetical protein